MRAWLGMLGFRVVVVDVHGEVAEMNLPSQMGGDEE
jgi:hypothetical protein